MKQSLLNLLFLLFLTTIWSQSQTAIPDANFEQALINLGFDDVLNGQVLTANISGVQQLYLEELNIQDLTGIQDFTALTLLSAYNNDIAIIDVSNNLNLTALALSNNNLSVLDVSQNTALEILYCGGNNLSYLNVSKNNLLEVLYATGNDNLSCIAVNEIQLDTIPTDWYKDDTTSFTLYENTIWYVGLDADDDGFVGSFEEVVQCDAQDESYSLTQPEISDCNDNDAAISEPQLYYVDADLDGFGSSETEMLCASVAPDGYADNSSDCFDLDFTILGPQLYYVDNDGDGYGAGVATVSCDRFPPSGYTNNNDDCNDFDSNFQIPRLFYLDNDGDGYGSQQSISVCEELDPFLFYMYVPNNSDCNDSDPSITEPQLYYVDADGDGFGSSETEMLCASVAPVGYADNDTDCKDLDRTINSNTIWYAGIDLDSDGFIGDFEQIVQCEAPGVNYTTTQPEVTDCDDGDININPGMEEILNNNIDDDCNPLTSDDVLGTINLSFSDTHITPNPFNTIINIELSSNFNNSIIDVKVFDLNGRLVFSKSYIAINNIVKVSNLDTLEQAPYIIKVVSKKTGASILKQLIKI
ncbi:T9SS type A sorting domain-containing protein [Winogradskyella sp.]|nr:T9SS type A sorting domain-containing protein [Winogradskyella sp.]